MSQSVLWDDSRHERSRNSPSRPLLVQSMKRTVMRNQVDAERPKREPMMESRFRAETARGTRRTEYCFDTETEKSRMMVEYRIDVEKIQTGMRVWDRSRCESSVQSLTAAQE